MIKYEGVVIMLEWIAVIRYLHSIISLTDLMDRSYAFYWRLKLVINICLNLLDTGQLGFYKVVK